MTKEKKKVLFLCTHNSARSQMAEAFLRELYPEEYEAYSAGTQKTQINPYVIQVMEEIGIDMDKQYSKNAKEMTGEEYYYIITVCDKAKGNCPFFPKGVIYMHKNFPDPSSFEGNEKEKLEFTRKIRDQIRKWIKKTFKPEEKD